MKLLLLSNSTNYGESFLEYALPEIKNFIGNDKGAGLFVPFAAILNSYSEYENKVKKVLNSTGLSVKSIHRFENMQKAIDNASFFMVGGGNTWMLRKMLGEHNLMSAIKEKVKMGIPYIGWSAGSNLACPTILTTNDMPIVVPDGVNGYNLVPFQINPHYIDSKPDGHAGESREMRIKEFIAVNKQVRVVGLREGSMLKYEHSSLQLLGNRPARVFRNNDEPLELSPGDDAAFLYND